MAGTCSLPMVHSKNKRRQLGFCIESVLDLSLLNIFSNDKEWNRERIYYMARDIKAGRSYRHFGGQAETHNGPDKTEKC